MRRRMTWTAARLSLVFGMACASAQDTPTTAQKRLLEIRRQLEQASAQLEAVQARVGELERAAAQAQRAVTLETVDRARTGDEGALRQVLDSLGEASFVEYQWARAVKGAGIDSGKVVAAIRRKLADADPRLRCKLCWLLGQNRSPAAAVLLRDVLAGDPHADVLANAIHALERFPDSPANIEAVRRHAGDERKIGLAIGFYPRGTLKQGQPLGLMAHRYVDRRNAGAFAAVAGEVIIEKPTLFCAGFQWRIEGDVNHNCMIRVRYRRAGSPAWRNGFPFLRCESWPSSEQRYPFEVGNLLAGSIFNLTPGTSYEVELSLADPDGGAAQTTVTVTTRTEPPVHQGVRTLYVAPEGTAAAAGTSDPGAKGNPFQGILAADRAAQPGDVLLLLPGVYAGSFNLTRGGEPDKPIVWRGSDRDQVILDGSGKDESLSFSGCDHLQFEDLTFRGANQGCIKTFGSRDIVVRRCIFREFRYAGIMAQGRARRERAGRVLYDARNCQDWFVLDNEIYGPANWQRGRRRSSYGVNLSGAGHVIAFNRIQDCWDTISLAGGRGEPRSGALDICYNDLRQATDDGIEADDIWHNTRIFRNRLTNTFSSVSHQPVFGGPAYVLYNAMYNTTNKPFKLHVNSTGMIIAQNTAAVSREAFYGGSFHDACLWNNLILGLAGEQGYWMSVQGDPLSMDHTGYTVAAPGPFIKLNNVRYADMAEFVEDTGQNRHAVQVDWDVLVKAPTPPAHERAADPAAVDLRLRPGSGAVDAGVLLPGINDGCTGKAPDLGCYEQGQPLPHYGPRRG